MSSPQPKLKHVSRRVMGENFFLPLPSKKKKNDRWVVVMSRRFATFIRLPFAKPVTTATQQGSKQASRQAKASKIESFLERSEGSHFLFCFACLFGMQSSCLDGRQKKIHISMCSAIMTRNNSCQNRRSLRRILSHFVSVETHLGFETIEEMRSLLHQF